LDETEKDSDKVRAADAILKAGKTHLGKDEAPPRIVFHFQTIDKQLVIEADGGERLDED
jgi:hypothetical protein